VLTGDLPLRAVSINYPRHFLGKTMVSTGARAARTHLPQPGTVVVRDFRNGFAPEGMASLKVVQWNIERGYKLESIARELRELKADVIALQEVDWGCERTGSVDVGGRLGKMLGYNYIFLCEFEELQSDIRSESTQGGGVHGNAILTRFDLAHDPRIIRHRHQPVNWERPAHPLAKLEPRRGERVSLAVDLVVPWDVDKKEQGTGLLTVYCCHLEVFCGATHRVAQFSEIFADARRVICEDDSGRGGGNYDVARRMMILGDLNSMGNGIARLSPSYCKDLTRWLNFGWSEAEWWHHNVFSVRDDGKDPAPPANMRLKRWGLDHQVCVDAVNPNFYDPYLPGHDVTLDNPRYALGPIRLMTGKLDWLLLRGLAAFEYGTGNDKYSASDHKLLVAEVRPGSLVWPKLWGRNDMNELHPLVTILICIITFAAGWWVAENWLSNMPGFPTSG